MENYGQCNDCGSPKIFNPKTGKTFCQAKCWLNKKQITGERKFVNDINSDIRQQQIEKAMEAKRAGINASVALNDAVQFFQGKQSTVENVLTVASNFKDWLDRNT